MKFLAALVVLISSSAFAQLRCVDKLVQTGAISASHQLSQAEWNPTVTGPLIVSEATRALSVLVFSKLLCKKEEIEIEAIVNCVAIDATRPEHVTCSAYSTLGQFIISTDYSQNVSITFHKAPRPPQQPY